MKSLTLSIVIPVYNEEDHLEKCLDSIAAQTVLPDEVIVVDNNSTDRSVHIAEQYPFVTVIREIKQGIFYSRNAGYNSAKSELIGRIDADTVLPENWVVTAKKYLEARPNEVLVGGCYMYDWNAPKITGLITEYFSFKVNRIILGNYIAWGSNCVFRKSMWESVKNDVIEDNAIHEDIDLGIHLTNKGYKITYDKHRKVGIDSRVFSDQRRTREQHFEYLKRWPETLKRHNLKRAWIGTIGAHVVYNLYYPLLMLQSSARVYKKLSESPLRLRD